MRIGIILHGPEIIDEGSAKRIIEILKKEHDVTAKLGGTMGRTAVLDAELEDIIDISQGLTPAETMNMLRGDIDLAVLLNHGKTLETGRHFGRLVASKLNCSLHFIHIERPESDGRIIYYDTASKPYAEIVRDMLRKHSRRYDLPIEQNHPTQLHVRSESGALIRRVLGAFPGENIRVDGVVIGHITHPGPEIVCRDGTIVELRGGKIKPHGLEKLKNKKIDLFKARVKTGNIRRTNHIPKIKAISRKDFETVAIIDHCAESIFELIKDARLVVSVGDDTTAIAADILARFGIPIIGLTDGDLDSILDDTQVPEGSIIIQVREGFDDIIGGEVFKKLMDGKQKLHMQNVNEFISKILDIAEKYLEDVKYY